MNEGSSSVSAGTKRRQERAPKLEPLTPRRMNVSIVTVCFNSAGTIEDTIRSVVSQQHDHLEYIVVDGGSTDGTLDILAKYRDRIAKCISEPDRGIYDAMNKGIALAQGEVIGFLNADDVYLRDTVISEAAAAFGTNGCDAVYGDLLYVSRKGNGKIVRYWQAGRYKAKSFYTGWVPPHPTFFCRTALFERLGAFDPDYAIAGDFELMLRFIEKHRIRVRYVPRPFVRMRVGGKANTLQGVLQGNREIIRAFRDNGLRFSPRFFCLKPFRKIPQLARRSGGRRRVPDRLQGVYE